MEKNRTTLPKKNVLTSNTEFEEKAWNSGAYLCGIDEVGRGCLAGPVVTAAVILKPFCNHILLVDSKILPEKKRSEAALWIQAHSWYAFGMADNHEIDTIGIYQATKNAMLRAIYSLLSQPHIPVPAKIVIDAMPLQLAPGLTATPDIESFCYGESRSISIAAASIMAKVKRDSLLTRITPSYPTYGFESNKGYGATIHQQALLTQGPTLLHRKTFITNLSKGPSGDSDKQDQISLF